MSTNSQQLFNFETRGGIVRRDSQCGKILEALQSGRKLTPLDALREFGCFRLGARVWDLKKQGYNIETNLIEVESGARVAEYFLVCEVKQ